MDLNKYSANLHEKVKINSPLTHNITNFVVMNSSANILLAAGASPVMAHSENEVEDMTAISDALVLNIGTLEKDWVKSMIKAGKKANEKNIPVILDPVGSGATPYRTKCVKEIIEKINVSVIRGNASEIFSIDSENVKTRGVDSSISSSNSKTIDAAMDLSKRLGVIIAMSGKTDITTDGKNVILVENGDPILTKITGMGCGLTALTGAFCAVSDKDYLNASAAAFAYFGVCADLTAKEAKGPGSFYSSLIDTLHMVKKEDIEKFSLIKKIV